MENRINFSSKNSFELNNKAAYCDWLIAVLSSESKTLGELSYVFCDDNDILQINQTYLDHDTFTDIITFDYSEDDCISAELFISTERVKENAKTFGISFENELQRVLVHGVLHCCGYEDSTDELKTKMRRLEDEKMKLFHVEHK